MNAKIPFLASLAAAALCTGCQSTGPNTERGAVTGAALGAVGGAILGNNIGDGNNKAVGAAIGAAAGGAAGAAYGRRKDREMGTEHQVIPPANQTYGQYGQPTYQQGQYGTGAYVTQPPPTPTSEPQDNYTPQPNQGAVWVRGHWEYTGDGRNYQWVPGHWENPPAGARTFVAGHWEQQGQGYTWVPSRWQ